MKVKDEIKSNIIDTANTLLTEGNENPTNDQVRERMGGGSLSHISPVMREWRENRKAAVVAALAMPADLKKAIETALGQVWTTADRLASSTIETIRQESKAATEAATNERDEALIEITQLEERIVELEQSLSGKDQQMAKMQKELERTANHHTRLTAESAALESRLNDRDDQIKDLKGDLKEARDNNKNLQSELVKIAKNIKPESK